MLMHDRGQSNFWFYEKKKIKKIKKVLDKIFQVVID